MITALMLSSARIASSPSGPDLISGVVELGRPVSFALDASLLADSGERDQIVDTERPGTRASEGT